MAGITPRTLDYWVTTDLVTPHSAYQGPNKRREFFLFSFRELVQLRIIAALRAAGLSLQKIRAAIEALAKEAGDDWQKVWLVTDGSRAFVVHSPATLEEVGKTSTGQLAFAAIGVGRASEAVAEQLGDRSVHRPFAEAEYRGTVGRINPRGSATQ